MSLSYLPGVPTTTCILQSICPLSHVTLSGRSCGAEDNLHQTNVYSDQHAIIHLLPSSTRSHPGV
jgi:hypothetical protein